MARLASIHIALLLGAAACSRQQQSPRPATVEPLRWLSGTWRGTGNGGNAFFEGYEFAGDSLLRIRYYADSTATIVSDSGAVYVRGDTIFHEAGGGIWRVVRLDSASVRFEPHARVTNAFTWVREGPDAWVATLETPGRPPTVYRLERLGGAR